MSTLQGNPTPPLLLPQLRLSAYFATLRCLPAWRLLEETGRYALLWLVAKVSQLVSLPERQLEGLFGELKLSEAW